jgi:hypothetical protein
MNEPGSALSADGPRWGWIGYGSYLRPGLGRAFGSLEEQAHLGRALPGSGTVRRFGFRGHLIRITDLKCNCWGACAGYW